MQNLNTGNSNTVESEEESDSQRSSIRLRAKAFLVD